MAIYIIEHLEPRLWKWCLIEYKHISNIVGRENLWITNIKKESKAKTELKQYAALFKESIIRLVHKSSLQNVCILDPEAKETLTAAEAGKYSSFIFGGILGNDPPQKRTYPELTSRLNCDSRNLGRLQMSTDNAVYVVKKICAGTDISKIKFQNSAEISLNKNESVLLPYNYCLVDGKPLISPELIQFLKKKKGI